MSALSVVRNSIHLAANPLRGVSEDFDSLLDQIGDARFVLIGEASHGTHEFYRTRSQITQRLIREKGFAAVAVEGDWPDAYRVNRYVRDAGDDLDSETALEGFKRFPQWMWRNVDVVSFIDWLRAHNDGLVSDEQKVGFYGMDLYSLHASMQAVIEYLRATDPAGAKRAAIRYGCFDRFGDDPQEYGYAASLGLSKSCEDEVVAQLVELHRSAEEYAARNDAIVEDDLFYATQNARLVKNAERYYRSLFGGRAESWNVRDYHMTDTLLELELYLERAWTNPKIVVWAHNSHLGDARATEMADMGELNVGQLLKQQFADKCYSIGFSTFTGTVTAASDWGALTEKKYVRPALPGSYEALFHEADIPAFSLNLNQPGSARVALDTPRLQRAIGVIYQPETERQSHYFRARLPQQFDTMIHHDITRAVQPLELTAEWERGELPETYPSAL